MPMCLSVCQYAIRSPSMDVKLILQYVTMLGMMTNDPLNLAHYHGRLRHTVPIVWPIMHVSYDPENRHNGQIWIDLLVYSFIFKEPKIFQRASLMFIIILMKSKSSQKRGRKTASLNTTTTTTSIISLFIPRSLSTPPFFSHFISFALFQCWIAEYLTWNSGGGLPLMSHQPLWKKHLTPHTPPLPASIRELYLHTYPYDATHTLIQRLLFGWLPFVCAFFLFVKG